MEERFWQIVLGLAFIFGLAWYAFGLAWFAENFEVLFLSTVILFACFFAFYFAYFIWYIVATSRFLKKILARLGYISAQMFWGAHYYRWDYEKAFYWYKQAATQGNTLAQDLIALMYDEGLGILKNYDQANYWYKTALSGYKEYAEQGDTWAQYRIAQYYIRFEMKENYIEAYQWLILTKNTGVHYYSKKYEWDTQYNIKWLEAYQWYILAKTGKHHKRIDEYHTYHMHHEYHTYHPGPDRENTNEYLKFLEKQMTDSQIIEAQNLAQQFQKKH